MKLCFAVLFLLVGVCLAAPKPAPKPAGGGAKPAAMKGTTTAATTAAASDDSGSGGDDSATTAASGDDSATTAASSDSGDSGDSATTAASGDSGSGDTTAASGGDSDTTAASGGDSDTTAASGGDSDTTAASGGDTTALSDSGAAEKTSDKCWPKVENFMFLKAAEGCPVDNWKKGSVTYYLYRNSTVPDDLIDANVAGAYATLNFCGHSPNLEQADCTDDETPTVLPKGAYCYFMFEERSGVRITENCPVGFKWSWLAVDDVDDFNQAHHSGSTPLGEFFSFSTVNYYCCREDGDPDQEIVLPNKKEFVLLPTLSKKTCQKVKGMDVKKDQIFLSTEDVDAGSNGAPGGSDFPPAEYWVDVPKEFWGRGFHLSVCHYVPHGKKPAPKKSKIAAKPKEAPKCWPKTNFGFVSHKDGCPSGGEGEWKTGTVQHWEKPGGKSKVPAQASGSVDDQTMKINYCMHDLVEEKKNKDCTNKNTAKWEQGSYCLFHYKMGHQDIFDKSCPRGFFYNWFVIDDVDKDNQNNFTGEVPTGEYYDYGTVYYACCRNDGDVNQAINLPTDKNFIMMPTATDRKCQVVNGMKATYSELFYDSEDLDSDVVPLMKEPYIPVDYFLDHPKGKWGAGMHQKLCIYNKA